MKVSGGKICRGARRPAAGVLALGALVVGCGDKKSNPDAVTVDDLKFPSGLRIQDDGNGEATLWWSGANNEKDFDGYNVYGAKATDAIELQKNKVVQLLDKNGDAVTDAKNYLTLFNYNGTDLNTPGTKKDKDKEFEFLPIYTADTDADKTPLLPTCKPGEDGTCAATTKATAGQAANLNGETSFKLAKGQMTPGTKYCFTVLSSMKQGAKVSATTSEVRCFLPKYKTTVTVTAESSASDDDRYGITLGNILSACKAGSCPTPTSDKDDDYIVQKNNQANATTTEPLNFESFKPSGSVVDANTYLTGGQNTAIKVVGYKAHGFADPTLPDEIAALSSWSANLENGGGYTLSGASVPVFANYMYIVAVGVGSGNSPTSFNYYWLWIESGKDNVGRGKKTSMQVMLPVDADDLTMGDVE